jgi:hypothetical protein
MLENIPTYDGTEQLKASHLNDIVEALKSLSSISATAPIEIRRAGGQISIGLSEQGTLWLGVIVDPADLELTEIEYEDARYWIDRVYVANTEGDPAELLDVTPFGTGHKYKKRTTATNLAEIEPATHHLSSGTVVVVYTTFDISAPRQPLNYFWLMAPIGPSVVEHGHPNAAASGMKQAIYLVPCEATGDPLPPENLAPSLYCWIRNDQSSVDVTDRGWTATSILSFVRSSSVGYVGETLIEGVLIGEGLATGGNAVKTNAADTTAGYLDDEIVVVDPASPAVYPWLTKGVVCDPLRGDGGDNQLLLTHADWDSTDLTKSDGLTGQLTAGNGAEVVVVAPAAGTPYISFQVCKDEYDAKRHSTVLPQLNGELNPDIKYITIPTKTRTNAADTTAGYLDDEIIVDPGAAAFYWLSKTVTPGGAADNKLLIEHKDFVADYAVVALEDQMVYESCGNGVTMSSESPAADNGYNYITIALYEMQIDDPGHVAVTPEPGTPAIRYIKWLAVPAGTAEGDTLVWDNTAARWIKIVKGPGASIAGDAASQSPPSCVTIYRYDNLGRCTGWFYAVYPGPTWTWYSPWGCPEPGGTPPYGV